MDVVWIEGRNVEFFFSCEDKNYIIKYSSKIKKLKFRNFQKQNNILQGYISEISLLKKVG